MSAIPTEPFPSKKPPERAFAIAATDDVTRWDAFVGAQAGSTFCHQAGWRDVMSRALRHDTRLFVATDEHGEWGGVLPLVQVNTVLGRYSISMPFMNDGGPLGDSDAVAALVEHAVVDARQSGVKLLELRSRFPLPGRVIAADRKIGVHLRLPATVEDLWKTTFKAKLRSQVRRPTKEGMTARSGADQIDAFYAVFARNMRDLGTPVLPRLFFETLLDVFGSSVSFTGVYTAQGIPAAAACCLSWRNEVEVTWASSLRELNHLSPNMLLYAQLMEAAIGQGARVFNFGRCTPGSATHKFKLQWGGEDVPLPWPSWSPNGDGAAPSPDKPLFRVATGVWRRLPMAVANRVGPLLSRHLP